MGAESMSFWGIIGNLLIEPLKLVFEVIFHAANYFIGHPGLAIIVLSLLMNILVLPLYRRADLMQEAARDVDMKLRDGVAHIKKTFSGDERMMMLQTYYRQNNYKPTDALNGSVSLLLEIPFFMAAYQFLSSLEILDGVSLGPIKDLGAPDGLIVIGGIAINLLPILMTLINVISSALYLKGFPLKTKIQLYGMALFFLVFLYTSPAALVFYWTLNNVFSLVKTIFYKIKKPMRVIRVLTTAAGVAGIAVGVIQYRGDAIRQALIIGVGVCLLLPLALYLLGKLKKEGGVEKVYTPDRKMFVLGGLTLTVLVGVLIPSAYISASPQEYVDISFFHNPLWYIVSAASMAAGFFLVWFGVFYWLASPKGKVFFGRLMWVLSGVMLVNYMFFGTKLGVISSTLQYEKGVLFGSVVEQIVNVLVVCALTAVMLFIALKFKRATAAVLAVVMLAIGGMSAVNVYGISQSIEELHDTPEAQAMPNFDLSKDGKNVVVIMLDRAMNQYVPYMFKEKPELVSQFDGFTYYSNVISFGGYTNQATPALLGGYEYTPVEMNKRDNELLVDKHNEALKVMPVLFKNNGFDVTVCDPVYAGYQWVPDLSVFEGTGVDAYISEGKFGSRDDKQAVIDQNYRNFFCFSLMKSMPLFVQPAIYNDGNYNQANNTKGQWSENVSTSNISAPEPFMKAYHVMTNLSTMTNVVDGDKNTFLFFTNNMTHEPTLLQAPDYVPAATVDNTVYDKGQPTDRFVIDGQELKVDTAWQMSHYQINISAMLRLGEWFDYLRAEGVYDNTRIILVSDHGRDLGQIDKLVMGGADALMDVEFYYPLLMVKDFGSKGFTTSDEFMTNADVPTLATGGVINAPVNPFTGKPINNDEKYAHDQFVIVSRDWNVNSNNGYTYKSAWWASVKDNMWERENWTFTKDKFVLREHAFRN